MRRIVFVALSLCSFLAGGQVSNAVDFPAASTTAPEKDADFLTSLKQPVSWLVWGAELRTRIENIQNGTTLEDHEPDSEFSYIRLRPRIWTEITPVTNFTLNARLMSEPRINFHPLSQEGWSNDEGLFDTLNVDLERIGGQPVWVRIGRQDISMGDKWVIFDGTPSDGSRTEFFDAARMAVGLGDKAKVDVLAIQINSDSDEFLPILNKRNNPLAEQDERAGVLYVTYELQPALRVEPYYIYRHLSKQLANGEDGNLHLVGMRISGEFAHVWEYVLEGAPAFGDKNGRQVRAFGMQSRLTRQLGGEWKHSAHVGYEILSGDDPNTRVDEGWDPVWGRRARWSELMVYTFAAEANGRRGYFTNLQRPYAGWAAEPTRWLRVQADYMPMFALTNPKADLAMFSEDGAFRGHLLQTIARFKFTKNLSGHLWGEFFFPGDYYATDHRDSAAFLRAELMLTL